MTGSHLQGAKFPLQQKREEKIWPNTRRLICYVGYRGALAEYAKKKTKVVQRTRRAVLIIVCNVFMLLVWTSVFVRTFIDVKHPPAPHPHLNFDLNLVPTF